MKKFLVIFIFLVIFANFAIGQEAVAESPPGATFFSIVLNSGIVGIVVWSVIFTMFPFGTILGITAIICSVKSDGIKLPFSFKWLLISPVFYCFVGTVGAMTGIISAGNALYGEESAAKGAMIALGISNTLSIPIATIIGLMVFLFFIFICMIILHCKKQSGCFESELEEGGDYV